MRVFLTTAYQLVWTRYKFKSPIDSRKSKVADPWMFAFAGKIRDYRYRPAILFLKHNW